MAIVLALLCFSLPSAFATTIVTGADAGHGNGIMRQEQKKGQAEQTATNANLLQMDAGEGRPHRVPAEAADVFDPPAKIDDSFFGNWSPRFPSFVEQYPYFYAAAFVVAGLAFMIFVCAYVHFEDAKDEERRELIRSIRQEAAAGGYPMGASFAGQPPLSNLSEAALVAAAQRAAAAMARAPPLTIPAPASVAESDIDGSEPAQAPIAPAPKARAVRALEKAEQGIAALTSAMNSMTGLLAGDNVKKSSASTDTTSASGASTPRSMTSSLPSSAGSRSKGSGIRNGTVLVARVAEVIFASPTSWQEIGELTAGQQVYAAGPPETHDNYTMVPIKPRGAVDVKTLEILK
jgi:hypothetical protein